MRLAVGLLAVSLVCVGAMGQATPAAGADPIAAICAYEGTWSIKIDNVDTAHSKAGHEESTLRNDCWRSAGFMRATSLWMASRRR